MKMLLVCMLALLGGAAATENCYADVNIGCGQSSSNLELPSCSALYGAFTGVSTEMQAYANLHLERSYEFLLASTYFNNYETNRAGFTKLFRKMSDEAWANTIGLIKHITKRGGHMDFNARSRLGAALHRNSSVEVPELGALAKALDVHKELAERAFHIHREATRNKDALHDAEVAQYLEEEFIEKQADTVRNLAGHTNDLKRFIAQDGGKDLSMALYIFDEYLSKVA